MEKLLTISIAAYNVERYIADTLDSLMIPEIIDLLEIFVVDDGGKDNTLSIAQKYAERFPQSVFPVHKENGGYGSVFNYTIKQASGKYFKLLDGDDWFDRDSFVSLISYLKNSMSDILLTDFYRGPDSDHLKYCSRTNGEHKVLTVSNFKPDKPISMWSLVYKTELLRQSNLSLPEHSLYTDQYYSSIPFSFAKTVEKCPISVYCYRIGYEEQSSSRTSRIKHMDEMLKICRDISVYTENCKNNDAFHYLCFRASAYHFGAIKTILLDEINKKNLGKLRSYDRENKSIAPSVYIETNKNCKSGAFGKQGFFLFILRKTNYLAYWMMKLIPGIISNWQ